MKHKQFPYRGVFIYFIAGQALFHIDASGAIMLRLAWMLVRGET